MRASQRHGPVAPIRPDDPNRRALHGPHVDRTTDPRQLRDAIHSHGQTTVGKRSHIAIRGGGHRRRTHGEHAASNDEEGAPRHRRRRTCSKVTTHEAN